jgi:formylmethanofuran dehydrogenase subunit C
MSSPSVSDLPGTDLSYTIRVVDGGLGLGITINYIPRLGAPMAFAERLIGELKQRNIAYGIDHAAIFRLMQERVLHREEVIARGTPAVHGTDAELELLLLPPTFLAASGDGGRVDYKSIDNISQLKAGDVISRGTPAVLSTPGTNIFGKEIRAPAVHERIRHPAGKNTTISEDGLEMTATKDGFVRWNGHVIDVCEIFIVTGDVGLSTGNVRYQGDVEVYGDVQPGFEVVAGGNVRVFGAAEGKVLSENGTVTVSHGVMGTEHSLAEVTAEGDVQIGHARFGRIESKTGNVTANFAVEHSEIRAAKNLSLLAGPAISCVVEVGGNVDVLQLSSRGKDDSAPVIMQSSDENRRRYVRVSVSPPPEVQLARERSETLRGRILDLSASGLKVRLSRRLHEGDRWNLQFQVEQVEGTMWMEAEVIRQCVPLNSEAPTSGVSYGLEFTNVEPAVREALAKYCVAEDLRQHKLTGRMS